MFTGIVDHIGQITRYQSMPQGLQLSIATAFQDLVLGESIAVNGTCLTVTDIQNQTFSCHLSPETLALTGFSHMHEGNKVNLERAAKFGDRIGGHQVTGHVDGTAKVAHIETHADFTRLQFSGIDTANQGLLIPKGCIAVDGVSLTINQVFTGGFAVMLIPHTLAVTQLSQLRVGDNVNIEFDLLTKTIQTQVKLMLADFDFAKSDGNDAPFSTRVEKI